MLEVRNDDKTDNDKEKPRGNLLETDHMPFMNLSGIFPGSEVRRDIFSNPNEKTNKEKTHNEWHPILVHSYRKINLCFEIEDDNRNE